MRSAPPSFRSFVISVSIRITLIPAFFALVTPFSASSIARHRSGGRPSLSGRDEIGLGIGFRFFDVVLADDNAEAALDPVRAEDRPDVALVRTGGDGENEPRLLEGFDDGARLGERFDDARAAEGRVDGILLGPQRDGIQFQVVATYLAFGPAAARGPFEPVLRAVERVPRFREDAGIRLEMVRFRIDDDVVEIEDDGRVRFDETLERIARVHGLSPGLATLHAPPRTSTPSRTGVRKRMNRYMRKHSRAKGGNPRKPRTGISKSFTPGR